MKNVLKIFFSIFFLLIFSLPMMAQGNARWRKNMILIYVPDHEYNSMMTSAFKEWESNLKQKLQFYNYRASKLTNQKDSQAIIDIDVKFGSISGEDVKNSGTVSLSQAGSGAIRHATITIVLKEDEELLNDAEAKKKNDEEIRTIMLQQVGKVIGLSTSQDPQSVMYNEVQENQQITAQDVENVFVLYNWPYYRPLKSK